MTGTRCCVPGCHNNTKYNRNVSWHVFPKNPKLRSEWIDKIRRKRIYADWEPKTYTKICGLHFNLGGRKTRYDKHPKYYMPGSTTKVKENKQGNKESDRNVALDDIDIGAELIVGGKSSLEVTIDTFWGNTRNREKDVGDHTYCLKEEISGKVAELEKNIERMSRIIKTQEATINMLNLRLRAEDGNAWRKKYFEVKRNFRACECAPKARLSVENILNIDEALEFYTGFKNRHFFIKFFNLMKPGYKEIRRNSSMNGGRPRSLSYSEELFIVYSRLKLNLLEDDLAAKLTISRATVSNVWSCWIDLIYSELTKAPTWPSQEAPKQIIIDCVELLTETPSDQNTRTDTYSEQKAQHTVKGLVGITPKGVVVFVSDLYGGGKSERTIFEDCGILEFLEENDEVIADRGFVIEDLLDRRNVHFECVNPSEVDALSGEEYMRMKQTVGLRNRVEIVIDQIRDFGILKSTFPNKMRFKLNKIWKVCCLSVNLLSDPLFDDPLF